MAVSDTRNPGYNSTEPKEATEPLNSLEQARRIAGLAEEKLAQDIAILDMRPVCAYTDFFVICSGRSERQTKAIHDAVYEALKREGVLPRLVEGAREARWVLMDYLDAARQKAVALQILVDRVVDCLRLAFGVAGADHEEVRVADHPAHVEHAYVDGLPVGRHRHDPLDQRLAGEHVGGMRGNAHDRAPAAAADAPYKDSAAT